MFFKQHAIHLKRSGHLPSLSGASGETLF